MYFSNLLHARILVCAIITNVTADKFVCREKLQQAKPEYNLPYVAETCHGQVSFQAEVQRSRVLIRIMLSKKVPWCSDLRGYRRVQESDAEECEHHEEVMDAHIESCCTLSEQELKERRNPVLL